ncbi:MAG: hypothetical protein GWN58_49505 [Anaerolineae bacterium]|nr:hypothetical protein [Anaerolineae bacterium]
MKRLSSYCIYALIVVLAALVFLRLGMVERGVYAAAGASPGTSLAPVTDGWYGSDRLSGRAGDPNRWARCPRRWF